MDSAQNSHLKAKQTQRRAKTKKETNSQSLGVDGGAEEQSDQKQALSASEERASQHICLKRKIVLHHIKLPSASCSGK